MCAKMPGLPGGTPRVAAGQGFSELLTGPHTTGIKVMGFLVGAKVPPRGS